LKYLGAAVALFVSEGLAPVGQLLMAAGPGLIVAALFHIVPMILNARAWQLLLPRMERPGLSPMSLATWLRESVNGLLPVARIGGEIVAFRVLRRRFVRTPSVAASIVADMALSVISQALFALLGVALLFVLRGPVHDLPLSIWAVAFMILIGIAFALVQRAGGASALIGILNRIFAGRFDASLRHTFSLDRELRDIYARRADVASCLGWQLAGWVAGAGEIWIALLFLGQGRGLLDAIAIEALIQAVSSAAFIVPGALGVQEGAFVLIGAAIGLDGTTALALATARRLRDLVIFVPGLVAWHRFELYLPETTGRSKSP
jgi:putative membrane protein